MRNLALLLFAACWFALGFAVGQAPHAPTPAVHPLMGAAQPRSGKWPAVRRAHLAEHPECAVCGGREDLQVHHVKPFHESPKLELDPDNLITLCRDHHLLFGHLGSWSSWNVDVREDAEAWRRKIATRP